MENLNFNTNTLDLFSQITRYNISTYLDLYSIFIKENQPKILSYYRDAEVDPDSDSFDFLSRLIAESVKIDNLIKHHANSLQTIDQWELVVFLEDIRGKFETILNTSKWVGSSKTKNSWNSTSIQTQLVLSQNETLENVSQSISGEFNDKNDWVRIALENDLSESDYSIEGGTEIQLTKKIASSPNFFLQSVIDSLIGERMYGLDACRKITFENDDIKVMGYKETVKQSIDILILLKKGDIPEFPNLGMNPGLIGGNVGQLYYSSITRQLSTVFDSDDSLRNFTVTDVEYENTNMHLRYSVDTMYNLSINSTTKIAS
jgi:hypothetical protein